MIDLLLYFVILSVFGGLHWLVIDRLIQWLNKDKPS